MSPLKERFCSSFSTDCDDTMEESCDMSASSPPRWFNESNGKQYMTYGLETDTPKSRRLFDTDDDMSTSSSFTYRRSTIKPLNLSEESIGVSTDVKPTLARKRSSVEESKVSSNEKQFGFSQLNCSGSDESDTMMYASPRISPNSFITMDGRYVQSKNPFSSPMMEETPISKQNNNHLASGKGPPSLPTSFFSSLSSEEKMPSLLPPRHNHRLLNPAASITGPLDTPASNALSSHTPFYGFSSGYPDKRFSFTGSPIMEAAYEAAALETGLASSGSLRKVRKLHLCDDVVSATTHDLSGRQLQKRSDSSGLGLGQGISPNDVQGFPVEPIEKQIAPPPTPVKSRPGHNQYNSVYRRTVGTPGPPALERRRLLSSWKPQASNAASCSSEAEDNDAENNGYPKSRFFTDFDIIGELGEGSFGTVYKVLSRFDGCMYAIKAAQRKAKGSADRGQMLKEVYALAALSDQADTANFHIVRYHQAWMEDDRLFIQTELCIGTLRDEIAKGALQSERRKFKLLREMLLALDLIHRNNMVHLDIKPDNVFVKNDQYKLGDFGLVTILSGNDDVQEGDSRYMSMELLSGDKSDLRKCDVFSLGATLYEICLGRILPMNGQEWSDIRAGKLSPLLNTGQEMVGIIYEMMSPVPSMRPTPFELLQHHQLLSDEQRALNAAKSKVLQANMQLAAQEQKFQKLGPVSIQRRGLTRANTWNGTTLPYL